MTNDTIIRVLLIEDNEDDFLIIRSILSNADRAHYDLRHVETLDAGLKALEEATFDLVVVGFQFGQQTGLDFLDEVGRRDIAVPVMMTNGQGIEEAAVAAIKKGAVEYLPKTQAALEELPRVIARVIREWDVTQRKHAERELKNRQQLLDQVLENTLGFVFQAILHQDGNVTFAYVSHQAATVFEGLEIAVSDKPFELFKHLTADSRDVMRQRLEGLLQGQREATVFEDLEIAGSDRPFDLFKNLTADSRAIMRQRLQGLLRGQREATSCNLQFLTPAGNTKWLKFSCIPQRKNDGTIELNGVGIDITVAETTRRQEQEETASEVVATGAARQSATGTGAEDQDLVTQNMILQGISDASRDAIVVLGDEGKVLFWSKAAVDMFEYTEQEILGRDFHQVAVLDQISGENCEGLLRFAQTGEGPLVNTTLELVAVNKAGREFPVELTLAAAHADERWVAVGVIKDITEQT